MQRKSLLFTLMVLVGSFLISCKEDTVVQLVPTITGFEPATGAFGSFVTITGTNFDPIALKNVIKFNGTAATPTGIGTTSITVQVPVGTTTGTISVTVGSQTATSSTNFTVNNNVVFTATLTGAGEVPPVVSTATGTATLTFDTYTKIFTVVVTYTGLTAVNGHIHKAALGIAGGVIYPFTNPLSSPINYTSPPLTALQESDLFAGLNYANLHTTAYPAGEIRGQLYRQ